MRTTGSAKRPQVYARAAEPAVAAIAVDKMRETLSIVSEDPRLFREAHNLPVAICAL